MKIKRQVLITALVVLGSLSGATRRHAVTKPDAAALKVAHEQLIAASKALNK